MNLIFKRRKHSFKTIRKILKRIPHINEGGCGISALSMCKGLRLNLESVTFTFLYVESLKKTPDHIGLNYVNNQVFDCNGLITLKHYKILRETTYEELLNCLNNEVWNELFKRLNISLIERHLAICLKEVKNGKEIL